MMQHSKQKTFGQQSSYAGRTAYVLFVGFFYLFLFVQFQLIYYEIWVGYSLLLVVYHYFLFGLINKLKVVKTFK